MYRLAAGAFLLSVPFRFFFVLCCCLFADTAQLDVCTFSYSHIHPLPLLHIDHIHDRHAPIRTRALPPHCSLYPPP